MTRTTMMMTIRPNSRPSTLMHSGGDTAIAAQPHTQPHTQPHSSAPGCVLVGGDTVAIAARLRSAGAPFATDESHREALARLDAVLAAAAGGEAAAGGRVG